MEGAARIPVGLREGFSTGNERALVIGGALFGETEYEHDHALADRIGLSGRTEFTGFSDDVASHLDRAECAGRRFGDLEPFGLVAVEGMAAGLPVVAADAGGPAEIITDGIDGLLYPAGDLDALASILQQARHDAAAMQPPETAARTTAQRFWPKDAAGKVREFYDVVLRGAP